MRKCGSCLIIGLTASSIIGTGSKNVVLGGDKHNYYDNLGRGQALSPDPTPSAHLPPSPIDRDRAASAAAALIKEMPPM